ncbi:transposase [Roseivirga sp. 4D4]|uniref:IS200/IS605 family transposase n=1 Tax=Roseivirga sp. 4D4 TaxID=1889784 RepID=UPI000853C5D5|nr:IS200/IS605 family transposase [Roseivirga sp. 4D4]OEK00731.1 transposase [Roseivirga sp. 4D4]
MPGTFSQIYIQVVFAVKGRRRLISPEWESELFKYITGIVTNKGHKLLAINGVEDHVHMLVGLSPSCRLSDLVREIKKSSNAFINENRLSKMKFEWQEGYGAFSYSQSAISNVIAYIQNQKEHHAKLSFKEEYKNFMTKFEIDHEDKYLFD